MCEQNFFLKCGTTTPHDRIERNSSELPKSASFLAVPSNWHQCRTSGSGWNTELTRGTVTEIRRAHFGNRESTSRDHERRAFEVGQAGGQLKLGVLLYFDHRTVHPDLHSRRGALL